jgi:hypothetical protein
MKHTGYLLMWPESTDEIHIELITAEDAAKFEKVRGTDKENEISYQPLMTWFTQTHCNTSWPFNDCVILGTICICRC